MPKHIESRQSRLGADQPGGFCVRFFFFRIPGGRGAEAKFQSMEMQVVPVVLSRSQGRFCRFKITIGIDKTFLFCRGDRLPEWASHVRKLLWDLCPAGLYNPHVSLNTLPFLTNTQMLKMCFMRGPLSMCHTCVKQMAKRY